MTSFQTEFTQALLDADMPTPKGLVDPQGRVAGKRFDVYRNNVVVSLIEAMNNAFPAIKAIVGDAFFDAMAAIYVRENPPKTPIMMFYGDDFPQFLESFEPASNLPYLADVARLELARRHAYHAADETALDGSALAEIAPEKLMQTRFSFVASAILIQSNFPIHSIWRFNMVEQFQIINPSESVLLARPALDVVAHVVDQATFAFLTALQNQDTLETALDQATEVDTDFDLSAAIGLMIGTQIIHTVQS